LDCRACFLGIFHLFEKKNFNVTRTFLGIMEIKKAGIPRKMIRSVLQHKIIAGRKIGNSLE